MSPSASASDTSVSTASACAPPLARVGDQPDPVSARRLTARKVDHMAKQTADRRAHDMEDIEALGRVVCHLRSRLVNDTRTLA